MNAVANDNAHELDMSVRPAACSCGGARFAGSPTFVRDRHAAHVNNVLNEMADQVAEGLA